MKVLKRLAVVPVRQYDALAEKLRKAEARAEATERKLANRRDDARAWKAKAAAASRRLKQAEADIAAHGKTSDSIRGRLMAAERELAIAREHLMTIEMKLDVLEGAAAVLDRRTRAIFEKREQTQDISGLE